MIGQIAKTMPSSVLSSARPTGMCHSPIAVSRPAASPPTEACQAGRRSTPSITSTVAIGTAATMKESKRLPPTGVRS